MKILSPNDVTFFIRKDLREAISKDFCGRPFRIFREQDLHACCYFHLRRFLRGDSNWEILNEPLLRGLKGKQRAAQPDIVLFYKDRPQFLVELKFRHKLTGVQKKDRSVIRNAVKNKKWVKKAFYIEAVIQPSHRTKLKTVPYRNRSISIFMREDRKSEYNELYQQRRKPLPRTKRC